MQDFYVEAFVPELVLDALGASQQLLTETTAKFGWAYNRMVYKSTYACLTMMNNTLRKFDMSFVIIMLSSV